MYVCLSVYVCVCGGGASLRKRAQDRRQNRRAAHGAAICLLRLSQHPPSVFPFLVFRGSPLPLLTFARMRLVAGWMFM